MKMPGLKLPIPKSSFMKTIGKRQLSLLYPEGPPLGIL
jgi:hypothetical protein